MARYLMSYWGANTIDPFPNLLALKNDYLCGNNGNLLFKNAVAKAIDREDNKLEYFIMFDRTASKVTESYLGTSPDYINMNFDALILSEANLFSVSFIDRYPYFIDFLKKINIPILMVGVGVQTSLQREILHGSPIDTYVRKIVTLLLNKTTSIGVRGATTKEYLVKLGFPTQCIDIIGCPSMYTAGPTLSLSDKIENEQVFNSKVVALNGDFLSPTFKLLAEQHPNHLIFPQNTIELFSVLFDNLQTKSNALNPLYADWVTPEKIRYYTNIPQWRKQLSKTVFSFGSRIHGNILALLAGTPAVVLTTDARTEELAMYHAIPHCYTIPEQANLFEIYSQADFSKMLSEHEQCFERYKQFFEKNHIVHALNSPTKKTQYWCEETEKDFPDYPKSIGLASPDDLLERLRFLKSNYLFSQTPPHLPQLSKTYIHQLINNLSLCLGKNKHKN